MRAWLSVIAVLATFQTIVQVASTEDSSSIQPQTQTPLLNTSPSSLSELSTSKKPFNDEERRDAVAFGSDNDDEIEEINETRTKPDPSTQVEIENNLMSLFGMKSRPKSIDRSKAIIPEALKQLYVQITGQEYRESVNLPKPGLFTKSANTVRSFIHEGECSSIVNFFSSRNRVRRRGESNSE